MWVEELDLTKEKWQGFEEIAEDQLNAKHIEETTSPWNSPAFVIKNKSEKWRTLNDLKAVNKVIQHTGSLQPRISLPSLLSKDWPVIVIDLQNYFFTITL